MTSFVDTGRGFSMLTYNVSIRECGSGGVKFFKDGESLLDRRPDGKEVVNVAPIGHPHDS